MTSAPQPGEDWPCWRDPTHRVAARPVLGWPQCTECGAAPPYYERTQWVPADLDVPIVIPEPGSNLDAVILPGSAIVAWPELHGPDRRIWFEGWADGIPDSSTLADAWTDALRNAADRMVTDYPTSARGAYPADQMRTVGTYRITSGEISSTGDLQLENWMSYLTDRRPNV